VETCRDGAQGIDVVMVRCLGVFLLLLFVKLITCLQLPEPTMRYVSSRSQSHHIATFLRDAEQINGSYCTGFHALLFTGPNRALAAVDL